MPSQADPAADPVAEPMPWPGYEPVPGRALLSWRWAAERLDRSRRYWLATSGPVGTPHLAAIWAVWLGDGLAFSTGAATRKARNLAARPRCSVSTESAGEAVVVDGVAEVVADGGVIARIDAAYVAKYGSSALMPGSPLFVVRPALVHGLIDQVDPQSAPTRWRFRPAIS